VGGGLRSGDGDECVNGGGGGILGDMDEDELERLVELCAVPMHSWLANRSGAYRSGRRGALRSKKPSRKVAV
jgi:hypothetical protein